ncbi:MAG TPA: hypothetical protein PKD54_03415 [Pirellulaceae bacterium]|nr:hypothetical protein [Pirellulaceae bacterium]
MTTRIGPWSLCALWCAVITSSAPCCVGFQDIDQAVAAVAEMLKNRQDEAEAKSAPRTDSFEHFFRLRRDARKRPIALETSVTRYRGVNAEGKPVTVDLIGVVHIGEQGYYESLNRQFSQYDALLYELVAPEGTRVPQGGRGDGGNANPLAALQMGMKSVLGLEFQLDHIDYHQDNFVHADMSPEEFFESMRNNEESIGRMLLKAMGQGMANQSRGGGPTDAEMLLSLFSSNRELKMRRAFAEQMQQMEGGMAIFEGKDGSTIITHRNAKAMEVLRREIDAGKTKLGLFYGAGHLPDMQRRLIDDFQMQRGGQFWLTAWNMSDPERPKRND